MCFGCREPQVKQVPIGYFRTYTYHPLSFQAASLNSVNPSYYSYPLNYRQSYQAPVSWSGKSASNSFNREVPAIQAPIQSGSSVSSNPSPAPLPSLIQQSSPSTPPPAPVAAPSHSSISQPIVPEYSGQQAFPQQPPYPGVPQHFRPSYPYLSEYNPQVPHVQFVPCMCPVSVSVSGPAELLADKRSDDTQLPLADLPRTDLPTSEDQN